MTAEQDYCLAIYQKFGAKLLQIAPIRVYFSTYNDLYFYIHRKCNTSKHDLLQSGGYFTGRNVVMLLENCTKILSIAEPTQQSYFRNRALFVHQHFVSSLQSIIAYQRSRRLAKHSIDALVEQRMAHRHLAGQHIYLKTSLINSRFDQLHQFLCKIIIIDSTLHLKRPYRNFSGLGCRLGIIGRILRFNGFRLRSLVHRLRKHSLHLRRCFRRFGDQRLFMPTTSQQPRDEISSRGTERKQCEPKDVMKISHINRLRKYL